MSISKMKNVSEKNYLWGLLVDCETVSSNPSASLNGTSVADVNSYLQKVLVKHGIVNELAKVVISTNFMVYVVITENIPVPLKFAKQVYEVFCKEVHNYKDYKRAIDLWNKTCREVATLTVMHQKFLKKDDSSSSEESDEDADAEESELMWDIDEDAVEMTGSKHELEQKIISDKKQRDKRRRVNSAVLTAIKANKGGAVVLENTDEITEELVLHGSKMKMFIKRVIQLIENDIGLLPKGKTKNIFMEAIESKNAMIREGNFACTDLETALGVVPEVKLLTDALRSAFGDSYGLGRMHSLKKLANFEFDTNPLSFSQAQRDLGVLLANVDENAPEQTRMTDFEKKGWVVFGLQNSPNHRYRELAEEIKRLEKSSYEDKGSYYFPNLNALNKWILDNLNQDSIVKEQCASNKRKGSEKNNTASVNAVSGTCFKCNKPGHIAKNCPEGGDSKKQPGNGKKNHKPTKQKKQKLESKGDRLCHICKSPDHLMAKCPNNKKNRPADKDPGEEKEAASS